MAREKSKITVCYVLSYKHPKYVRSLVLLDLLRSHDHITVVEARNTTKSILRYPQTLLKLLYLRLTKQPDIYVLGFRGYEVFLPVRLLTIGKPLVYDEFINLYDWFVHEHKKLSHKSFLASFLRAYSKLTLDLSQKVLTDTKLNAEFSSRVHTLNPDKFVSIYVGTDETTFDNPNATDKTANKTFEVFFYGNMLPLHGVEQLLEAISKLKDRPIHFTIVGGKGGRYEKVIRNFLHEHKRSKMTYRSWVNYEDLPGLIAEADLCLGGPFGGTSQGSKVITGKTFQFLAMSKPVLIGRIDEETGFKDGVNCLEIEQGSAEVLADKILWAFKQRKQLPEIGQAGKKLYEQRFSRTAQKHILADVIDDLVKSN